MHSQTLNCILVEKNLATFGNNNVGFPINTKRFGKPCFLNTKFSNANLIHFQMQT